MVNGVGLRTAASPLLRPSPPDAALDCLRCLRGGRWLRSGELKRLTAVAHRRAEFLRPSPSVHIRGSRCVGREEERGGGGAGGRERNE